MQIMCSFSIDWRCFQNYNKFTTSPNRKNARMLYFGKITTSDPKITRKLLATLEGSLQQNYNKITTSLQHASIVIMIVSSPFSLFARLIHAQLLQKYDRKSNRLRCYHLPLSRCCRSLFLRIHLVDLSYMI